MCRECDGTECVRSSLQQSCVDLGPACKPSPGADKREVLFELVLWAGMASLRQYPDFTKG
jgi:hypothetical protein